MNRHPITLTVAISVIIAVPAHRATADEATSLGTLTVKIVDLQGTRGNVCVALYNDVDTFPDKGKHYRLRCSAIKDGESYVAFKNLPPGSYAAYAFHDVDTNRKLKTNLFGMPKEGVGASRGAKRVIGPPRFKDAKFEVGPENVLIQIGIEYL